MSRKRNCSRDFAALWIALNDEPMGMEASEIRAYPTTMLAADMLGISADVLATDIASLRTTFEKDGWPK
jgi:hypothetical protein